MTGETIEKLVIQIQADIDKAQRDLKKVQDSLGDVGNSAETAGGKVQTSGQKIGAALSSMKIYAVAAAAALSALGYKAIEAAGDAVEIQNKFEAVFKETSKSAEIWAEDFSDTVGRSTLETLQYLSTFQDTFVPLGFNREEAAQLSEQLTQLSVDLASFNNQADTETIAALQSALVGNHETMRRYGVIITQTTLDQELMNMGIEDGINSATEMEKVQARLNIIMNSTADAQGDAVRTSGSYANQLRALKGNISDVMAEAGQPAMEDLTQTMIDFNEWGTSGGYDQMAEGIGDVASAFAKVAEFGASTVQVLTDLYAVVGTQTLEVPEGMKMTDSQPFSDSFTIGVVPDVDLLDLTDSQLEQIKQTLEETATVQEEITGEYKKQTQELAKQNNSIPDWAGHSDYIKERLAEIGGKNIGDMMAAADTTSNIGGTQTIGSLTQSISTSSLSVPNVSVSSQLIGINTRGFSDVVRGLSEVKEAVSGISINVPTGSRRTGTSPGDVIANAKENKLGAGQVRLRY
jgi:hypothetical protein